MKTVVFGASGMVGQGVLRECLLDPTIERVLSIVRNTTDKQDAKVRRTGTQGFFFDFSVLESQFTGCDACFFSIGVTSSGMTGQAYSRAT